MKKIFKKESQCLSTASLIVCTYVLFMHFVFPRAWVDSAFALRVISRVAQTIPAVRRLCDDPTEYTNYWGVFFSIFWIISPIYWLLGFLGASRLNPHRHQKYVIETTVFRVAIIFGIFTLGTVFLLFFPVFHGIYYIRQTSNFLPLLMLSWWATAGIIYFQAQACRVLIEKIVR